MQPLHKKLRPFILAFAGFFFAGISSFCFITVAIAAPTLVALTGAAAPAGGNYSGFASGSFVINNAGQVAFLAFLNGGSSHEGIFAGTPGSLQTVALSGAVSPAGNWYSSFNTGSTLLNGNGQVAFHSSITGIFSGVPGSIQTVALLEGPAPTGGHYSYLRSPVLNEAGQVAFLAILSGASSSQSGVFVGVPGSIQPAVLRDTNAPGGGKYNALGQPALNGAGQVAFKSTITGGSYSAGIFVGAPGSIQAAAFQGFAAPAGGNYDSLGTPLLNGAGEIAFLSSLKGGSSTDGIFVGVPGSIQAAAIQGFAAPAGGNYEVLTSPKLNEAGQVAFRATLSGGSSTAGIFVGAPGSIQAAALVGAAAPALDLPAATYRSFESPTLNGSGQVAFLANLNATGLNANNDTALFAGSPGSLKQIVRERDLIDVDPWPGQRLPHSGDQRH